MKLRFILLSILITYTNHLNAELSTGTITHVLYANTPFMIGGYWNNGNELIQQDHTKLTFYINHKQRGPFRGTYYKYQDGEHLISVNFADDPGCCTGRIENNGKIIRWNNNSAWSKDTVATTPVVPHPPPATHNYAKITYHNTTITIQGYRLDWCLKRGVQCGKPAADAWCELNNKTKLSSHATAFKQATNIGRYASTYILGDKALCQSVSCDGFESIACELHGD
ncbi:MAG: hypothetical protein ACH34X_08420 [Thiolinea sp.]